MKKIVTTLFLTSLSIVWLLSTNTMATERLINIPVGSRVEKVGDYEIIRFSDGSKVEINKKTTIIYDNKAIKDNIYGECKMRFHDQAGKLQEGIGYLILNPSQGKLKGGTVTIPTTIKFIPIGSGSGRDTSSPTKHMK